MPKSLRWMLCVVLVATVLSSCNSKDDEDGNFMVLHGTYLSDVKTWDPANGYDRYSTQAILTVYETLYQFSYLTDSYQVSPVLAADLPKVSSDRLTVTIPIKRGVRFHDDPCFKDSKGKGRELKAQDFIYAFKRLALPSLKSSGWWIFDGKIAGIDAFHEKLTHSPRSETSKIFLENISGLKALDDYTLQIKLTRPYPQLIYILAMPFTAPLPHEAVETYGDETGSLVAHEVGTGAFRLKEWSPAKKIVFERNPTYHAEFFPSEGSIDFRKKGMLTDAGKTLPFLDRISIEIIPENNPGWLKFIKGQLDFISLPDDNFEQAITNQVNLNPDLAAKGIRLNMDVGTIFYFVSFNMKDPLLGGNKFLRQAISSALDREKWIDLFSHGTGRKQMTALPPGIPDRPRDVRLKYDYNPSLAKDLLKRAGYPDGKGLPALNMDMRGASSKERKYGEFFTQQLAAIGIKLNVIYNTFPAFLEKMKQGNLQVSFGAWAMDYPDAENLYQLLYGPNQSPGPNDSNFDNPAMNKLYEQMAAMEPGSKRADLIRKMDEILQEEVPWALGYYVAKYHLSHPWLLNFRGSEMIRNKFKYLRINRDVKKRYLEAG